MKLQTSTSCMSCATCFIMHIMIEINTMVQYLFEFHVNMALEGVYCSHYVEI